MANFTDTDLAAVEAAIAKGEAQVQFADRSVTNRPVDDLITAHRFIESKRATRVRQTRVIVSKGWQ